MNSAARLQAPGGAARKERAEEARGGAGHAGSCSPQGAAAGQRPRDPRGGQRGGGGSGDYNSQSALRPAPARSCRGPAGTWSCPTGPGPAPGPEAPAAPGSQQPVPALRGRRRPRGAGAAGPGRAVPGVPRTEPEPRGSAFPAPLLPGSLIAARNELAAREANPRSAPSCLVLQLPAGTRRQNVCGWKEKGDFYSGHSGFGLLHPSWLRQL